MSAPTVTTQQLVPQPILFIRRKTAIADIAATLGEILPRVFAHVQTSAIACAGPPFARYVSMGRGTVTIEAGMPIAAAATGAGDIEAGELPGGLVARATHVGPYDRLEETHATIETWIDASGHAAAGGPWEVYVTDPAQTPDPREWKTEVFWPLRSKL